MQQYIGLDTLTEIGFIGVFFLSLLEKLIPVIPSYVMLVLLGFGMVDGVETFIGTMASTILGSLSGSVLWYFTGSTIGEIRVKSLVTRYGKYFFLKSETYDMIVSLYCKNYLSVAFIGQVIPTIRIFTALPAGVLKLPAIPFMTATLAGITIWNLIFISAGFILRDTGIGPAKAAAAAVTALVLFEGLTALCLIFGRRCLLV